MQIFQRSCKDIRANGKLWKNMKYQRGKENHKNVNGIIQRQYKPENTKGYKN